MQSAKGGPGRGGVGWAADAGAWRSEEDARRRSRLLACACAYGACLLPRERLLRADLVTDAVSSGENETWLVRVETSGSFLLVRVDVGPDGAIRSISHPGVARKARRSHAGAAAPYAV
jgi:hypothetical protein